MASRDFLGRFGREAGSQDDKTGSAAGDKSDEIELSLGLSLGGCFGTDPAREAKKQCLARSSSIPSMCSLPGIGGEDLATAEPPPPPLHRTSSLPTEYDEARLQRKALQCQRRMAAKRKRLERRNSMNSSRSSAGGGDDAQEASGGFQLRRTSSSLPEQGGSGSGGADAKSSSAMNTASDNNSSSQNNNSNSSLPPTPSSGGTARPPNGSTRAAEQQAPLRTLRSLTMRTASTGDFRKTMMEEMPMVFSRLEGPNARRIDGFLYKFGKANDVRIVCVCHGNFLTPTEFVRHAGGGGDDLEHPLRHIIINKQPSEFL
ncbi:hypothetical protein PR202_ga29280 [Eleusine coracana subsp. coracana]|uniref:Ninja-family protein n=1 Tax=Eleusine coracana subsp. coracana TaxID=191504 RepID=A0AAV5DLL0_ELECO|nr:hypothetical protein QOZ80_7AG0575950 [Eleusine coracana subsp. coracana]GJN11111.1 hypothetical protein PR202_ga29280 [Eleusine coracana subsp. coracana]